jgi:hypothetical protein
MSFNDDRDDVETRAKEVEDESLRSIVDALAQADALLGRFERLTDEDRKLVYEVKRLGARFRAQLEGREPRPELIVEHGLREALATKGLVCREGDA